MTSARRILPKQSRTVISSPTDTIIDVSLTSKNIDRMILHSLDCSYNSGGVYITQYGNRVYVTYEELETIIKYKMELPTKPE